MRAGLRWPTTPHRSPRTPRLFGTSFFAGTFRLNGCGLRRCARCRSGGGRRGTGRRRGRAHLRRLDSTTAADRASACAGARTRRRPGRPRLLPARGRIRSGSLGRRRRREARVGAREGAGDSTACLARAASTRRPTPPRSDRRPACRTSAECSWIVSSTAPRPSRQPGFTTRAGTRSRRRQTSRRRSSDRTRRCRLSRASGAGDADDAQLPGAALELVPARDSSRLRPRLPLPRRARPRRWSARRRPSWLPNGGDSAQTIPLPKRALATGGYRFGRQARQPGRAGRGGREPGGARC